MTAASDLDPDPHSTHWFGSQNPDQDLHWIERLVPDSDSKLIIYHLKSQFSTIIM